MAGILDSKSRVLDVILTRLGREQMARGDFEVSFATFSDRAVQYKDDGTGTLKSLEGELFFEAFSQPGDEIIPEIANNGNFLLLQNVSPTMTVKDGILYEETENGFQQINAFDNISSFTDLTSNRWNSLELLKTETSLSAPILSYEDIKYEVKSKPLVEPASLPPVIVDDRFGGNLNTMFLPPVVSTEGGSIAKMKAFNNYTKEYTLDNIQRDLRDKTFASTKNIEIQSETEFGHEYYNFIAQAFIGINQEIKKYLVVDAGEFTDDEGQPIMQVYHLGFIFKESDQASRTGISKFSRGFTIIFHNGVISDNDGD